MAQARTSWAPWSPTAAVVDSGALIPTVAPVTGALMVTVGLALASVTVAVAGTGELTPSLTVSVAVNVPSSSHWKLLTAALGEPNEQVVPASTPAPVA